MMKLDKAIRIAKEIAAAYRRWGKQANPPYTTAELCEALTVLDTNGNFDVDLSEELTRTKRQLAAALAREAARKKQES